VVASGHSMGAMQPIEETDVPPRVLWTALRCARGHLAEHAGAAEPFELDESCWCGAPRVAATVCRGRRDRAVGALLRTAGEGVVDGSHWLCEFAKSAWVRA